MFKGNPPDAPMLVPAITRIKTLFGRAPKAVTADRGYGEASVESGLVALGVERIAIPRKGKPGKARRAVESARGFRTLVKWRTGSEGRVSHLKHSFGFERTMLDGIAGAKTWCGWDCSPTTASRSAPLQKKRRISRQRSAKDDPPRTRPTPGRRPVDHRQVAALLEDPRSCRLHPPRPAARNGGGKRQILTPQA